jgi:YYY domain-containing protein
MTNSWDFPIYLLITGLVILYFNYSKSKWKTETFLNTAIYSLVVFFLALIFSLPFHFYFQQIAQGIAFVNAHSFWWQLLVLWGYQWVFCLNFVIFLALKKKITNSRLLIPDIYILILILVATLLIIIPEIIYVKDIYIPSFHRANTMFKLVYQSFMIYALASGYIIVRILKGVSTKPLKFLLSSVFCLLFSSVMLYPHFAIKGYYGDLKNFRGLDGLTFLQQRYPEDFDTLGWLEKNIQGQPTILEAVGDSYTEYNRLSMASGLPTVEGWLVHEWLWRGSFDEPGKRAADVQKIYESKNLEETKQLINKYKIDYIYIGGLEREKYQVDEKKFAELGEIVFQSGNSKLYRLY